MERMGRCAACRGPYAVSAVCPGSRRPAARPQTKGSGARASIPAEGGSEPARHRLPGGHPVSNRQPCPERKYAGARDRRQAGQDQFNARGVHRTASLPCGRKQSRSGIAAAMRTSSQAPGSGTPHGLGTGAVERASGGLRKCGCEPGDAVGIAEAADAGRSGRGTRSPAASLSPRAAPDQPPCGSFLAISRCRSRIGSVFCANC